MKLLVHITYNGNGEIVLKSTKYRFQNFNCIFSTEQSYLMANKQCKQSCNRLMIYILIIFIENFGEMKFMSMRQTLKNAACVLL